MQNHANSSNIKQKASNIKQKARKIMQHEAKSSKMNTSVRSIESTGFTHIHGILAKTGVRNLPFTRACGQEMAWEWSKSSFETWTRHSATRRSRWRGPKIDFRAVRNPKSRFFSKPYTLTLITGFALSPRPLFLGPPNCFLDIDATSQGQSGQLWTGG